MGEPGRYAVAHLDDIEALPGPGTLTWRPVRATLGVRAFGTNAYTAAEAGPGRRRAAHGEPGARPRGELYFVARGRAAFRLDGEEIDAPARTYVFVRDPSVHRHAIATEPGTTVLSFGGPATFTPRVGVVLSRRPTCRHRSGAGARDRRRGPRDASRQPGLLIYVAKLEARAGRPDAARGALRRAPERQPSGSSSRGRTSTSSRSSASAERRTSRVRWR